MTNLIDPKLIEPTIWKMEARLVSVDWTDPKRPIIMPVSCVENRRTGQRLEATRNETSGGI